MDVFQKEIISSSDIYLVKFTKNRHLPYLLFIHGGPGFHCGILEYLIEHNELFQSINCNIVMYDQRHCGRSASKEHLVTHQDNINDLHFIISLLQETHQLKLGALVGHSYGAKLLADYITNHPSDIFLIFISFSESLLRPRLNNLMLDLAYLKQNEVEKYQEIFSSFQKIEHSELWTLTEALSPYFQINQTRGSLYWANMQWYQRTQAIQKELDISVNFEVFTSVRKDIYSQIDRLNCNIKDIPNSKLWISGFHDFIMDGQMTAFSTDLDIITFYQSAHYPHIEENERFCRIVNEALLCNKN